MLYTLVRLRVNSGTNVLFFVKLSNVMGTILSYPDIPLQLNRFAHIF